MDCLSWRYHNGFKAKGETMALGTTCAASSRVVWCFQQICACSQTAFQMEDSSFCELRFMFEDIFSKISVQISRG